MRRQLGNESQTEKSRSNRSIKWILESDHLGKKGKVADGGARWQRARDRLRISKRQKGETGTGIEKGVITERREKSGGQIVKTEKKRNRERKTGGGTFLKVQASRSYR